MAVESIDVAFVVERIAYIHKIKEIVLNNTATNGADWVKFDESARFIQDLGLDSLDLVEAIMAFEEGFGISIPDEDAQKVVTVGDVQKYIQERTTKNIGEIYTKFTPEFFADLEKELGTSISDEKRSVGNLSELISQIKHG